MNARRAARELALLAFPQLAREKEVLDDKDIGDIIVTCVRTLVRDSEGELKKSLGAVLKIKEFIENYEFEHPENLELPMEVSIHPVPIPMTSDMIGRLDTVIDAIDKTFSAIEITEMASLVNIDEVKDYAIKLIKTYRQNKDKVDEEISKYSKGWNIDRLVRTDGDILKIAISEILFLENAPDYRVSIDEAVELAKRYGTEESSSFINGILRQVVEENNLEQCKK